MVRLLTLACLFALHAIASAANPPFADIHLHYNWDQKEVISAQEVVKRLKSHNVVLAVVTATPSELALELAEPGGLEILPFFSPYITVGHRDRWYLDDNLLVEAEKALQSGNYYGIGELHISADLGPPRNNKILQGLLKLAERFQLPFMIHTEASNHRFFMPICQAYPKVRFLWAHAGGKLAPNSIDQLMAQCPNVWSEVSVRDPWRYHSLVDNDNQLLPGWVELFTKYQDRFMTGTDPVWSVTRFQRWEQADDGWDYYDQLIKFHRDWLKQLPEAVEEKIRLLNAQSFFSAS